LREATESVIPDIKWLYSIPTSQYS